MIAQFRLLLAALLLAFGAAPAFAQVKLTFWGHERDENYPHAFITMEGRSGGRQVSEATGFTARRITPRVLFGPVDGMLERPSRGYMRRATTYPAFSIMLDDAGYARVRAHIQRWRALAQPSYDLNRRNCVHFVLEAAAAVGLRVNRDTPHTQSPRQFLDELRRLNPQVTPERR